MALSLHCLTSSSPNPDPITWDSSTRRERMKIRPVLFVFLLVTMLAAACAPASTPAPAPTAVPPTAEPPTQLPQVSPTANPEPAWNRVSTTGTIIFGSSLDYPPYESYDANFQPTGFDVALARELGTRLGYRVEFLDIPFEGLLPAVQSGQVDAGIAAISVTPD